MADFVSPFHNLESEENFIVLIRSSCSHVVLSCFGHAQSYLQIEGNRNLVVY